MLLHLPSDWFPTRARLIVGLAMFLPKLCKSCVYTAEFAARVVRDFDGLGWDLSQPAVSILELYVDFVLSSGTSALCLSHKGARGSRGPVRS